MLTLIYSAGQVSCVSILYISVLESHTASVLPQHAVIDERIPPASLQMRPLLRGRDPHLALCPTPKVGCGGQQKHLAKAPEFQGGHCYCRVKHFPRYSRGGPSGRGDAHADAIGTILSRVTIVSKEKAQHLRNNERNFCNMAYLEKPDTTTAA